VGGLRERDQNGVHLAWAMAGEAEGRVSVCLGYEWRQPGCGLKQGMRGLEDMGAR